MPCHESSSLSFPADFPLDTPHLHQALAVHNVERTNAGLPIRNFLELSVAERHDVLDRAEKIKAARLYDPIYIEHTRQQEAREAASRALVEASLEREARRPGLFGFGLVCSYLFLFGVIGLSALLWKIL